MCIGENKRFVPGLSRITIFAAYATGFMVFLDAYDWFDLHLRHHKSYEPSEI